MTTTPVTAEAVAAQLEQPADTGGGGSGGGGGGGGAEIGMMNIQFDPPET